jgi:hypothetical protein
MYDIQKSEADLYRKSFNCVDPRLTAKAELLCSLLGNTNYWFTLIYNAVPVPKHHAMKAYWGSGGIAPRILDLGTR